MTVDIPNCENVEIDLTDAGELKFKATSEGTTFGFDMEFFAEVDKEASAWNTKGRNVLINLAKKDTEAEYWTRLTKNKTKNQKIQVDWSKWVDEDDEGAAGEPETGGDFDPSMMQGFGGPGGAGGMPGMGGMGGMPGMEAMAGMGGMGGMPGMGGMGGMPGMGGMGGMPGMEGMNMEEMMKNLGGAGAGMPDSDDEDEEEEADGAPKKDDGLGDLDGDAEKAE